MQKMTGNLLVASKRDFRAQDVVEIEARKSTFPEKVVQVLHDKLFFPMKTWMNKSKIKKLNDNNSRSSKTTMRKWINKS